MAWNKPEIKSIQSIDTTKKAAPISVGAPIAYSPSLATKGRLSRWLGYN